jgi:hypothetical protein
VIFGSVNLILLFIMIILVVCGFNETIRAANASLLCLRFWLFVSSL